MNPRKQVYRDGKKVPAAAKRGYEELQALSARAADVLVLEAARKDPQVAWKLAEESRPA